MVGNENSDQNQKNPWDVLSLYQFQNFCCPSCVFKVPVKQDFIEHAYKNHPACVDFLSIIEDDSLSDIVCPWNIDIKIEENIICEENNIYEDNNILDEDEENIPLFEKNKGRKLKIEANETNPSKKPKLPHVEAKCETKLNKRLKILPVSTSVSIVTETKKSIDEENIPLSKKKKGRTLETAAKGETNLSKKPKILPVEAKSETKLHKRLKILPFSTSVSIVTGTKKSIDKENIPLSKKKKGGTLETEAKCEPKILPAEAKCESKISKKPKILPVEAKCPNCELESFKSIFEFNEHIKKCFEKQPVRDKNQCEACEWTGRGLKEHRAHWNEMHKNEPLPYLCYACDYRTYTKFYMDQHEKVEHKTEDFTCETCGYKTKHQHAIKRHLKYVHDDSRNFQCEVCAKSVKTHK